jgi:hypothetical protein
MDFIKDGVKLFTETTVPKLQGAANEIIAEFFKQLHTVIERIDGTSINLPKEKGEQNEKNEK